MRITYLDLLEDYQQRFEPAAEPRDTGITCKLGSDAHRLVQYLGRMPWDADAACKLAGDVQRLV